jgi:hypothetical protein
MQAKIQSQHQAENKSQTQKDNIFKENTGWKRQEIYS